MPMLAFTGDDTGLLKQVTLGATSNVVNRWGEQGCGRGVSRACWGPGGAETHIGVGLDDGAVRFWPRSEAADSGQEASDGTSQLTPIQYAAGEAPSGAPYGGSSCGIVGVHTTGGDSPRVVATDRRGLVRVWAWRGHATAPATDPILTFQTVKTAAVARSATDGSAVAVGGKGADASIWSIETGQATWRARNLPNDELDLEVPIWLTDLSTVEAAPKLLATGHGFVQQRLRGEVRLYDVSAQRRPVCRSIAPLGEEAVSAVVASADGRHVFAGSVSGSLARLDARMGLKPVERYRSIGGSIRELALHPSLPLLACACLDRKMRVFSWGFGKGRWSAERKTDPIATVYLKQRLSAVLFSADEGTAAERRAFGVRGGGEAEMEEEEEGGDVEKMLAELPVVGGVRRAAAAAGGVHMEAAAGGQHAGVDGLDEADGLGGSASDSEEGESEEGVSEEGKGLGVRLEEEGLELEGGDEGFAWAGLPGSDDDEEGEEGSEGEEEDGSGGEDEEDSEGEEEPVRPAPKSRRTGVASAAASGRASMIAERPGKARAGAAMPGLKMGAGKAGTDGRVGVGRADAGRPAAGKVAFKGVKKRAAAATAAASASKVPNGGKKKARKMNSNR
jgi:ribosome biogenesis protein NSA1